MDIQGRDRRRSGLQVGDRSEAHGLANIPFHERVGIAVPVEPLQLPDTPKVGKADRRVQGNLRGVLEDESPYITESIDATRARTGRLHAAGVQAHQRPQEIKSNKQQTIGLTEPALRFLFLLRSAVFQVVDDLGENHAFFLQSLVVRTF